LLRLCSLACGVKIAADGDLGLMREKRGAQARQLLVGLQASEAFAASIMAAPVHRKAMAASRHRFTSRQIRRMEPLMFSMMLVQANDLRN
jgi:hypothetical protein